MPTKKSSSKKVAEETEYVSTVTPDQISAEMNKRFAPTEPEPKKSPATKTTKKGKK